MEKLFIGIKGHVICLDKETGKSVWTKQLKTSSGITNVHLDGDYLFASTRGHLFCLNPDDGSEKWTNPLNGMGSGPCIIATHNQTSTLMASESESSAATNAMLMSGLSSSNE